MEALWYLLILAPFLAVPILWWNYRRKQFARDQVSGTRWESMVKEAMNPAEATPAPAAVSAPTGTVISIAPQTSRYERRGRVLDPAQTVLFLLLRQCLADHEILTRVTLGCLITVPAGIANQEREQRQRGLDKETVDFAVCDKSMKPLVVIDLLEQAPPTAAPDFRGQCLSQAGIRYLRLVRTSMPKRDELRAVVLGA